MQYSCDRSIRAAGVTSVATILSGERKHLAEPTRIAARSPLVPKRPVKGAWDPVRPHGIVFDDQVGATVSQAGVEDGEGARGRSAGMRALFGIFGLLLVVSLSILITRIATIALTHTGLARESARFQARSAFTGAGFTTQESEKVVNHPVRRRIVMLLMLLGNAGIVTSVASLMVTFITPESSSAQTWVKVTLLVAGLSLLWLASYSQFVDRWLSRAIEWTLARTTRLDTTDLSQLMRLSGDYGVSELAVRSDDWIADKKLSRSRLRDEGVIVLGVQRRDGTFVGAPDGDTQVLAGDVLVLYGRGERLAELDRRQRGFGGDMAHARAVETRIDKDDRRPEDAS